MEWEIAERFSKLPDEEILSITKNMPEFSRLLAAIRTMDSGNGGPKLVSTLINENNFNTIVHSAGGLKNCPYFQSGFECFLDHYKCQADFGFSITRTFAEAATILGNQVADWFGETDFKGKDRIISFLTRWMDKKSLLYYSIYGVYFELDTSVSERAGIPGLFVHLQSGNKRPEWYETIALAALDSVGIVPKKEMKTFISNYFRDFTETTEYFHMGVMLSRDDFPVKFVAEYTDLQKARQILGAHGFDISRYIREDDWTRLLELTEGTGGLSIDFIYKDGNVNWVSSRIGIEILPPLKNDEFIDWIISKGCCSPEKGEALRNWKGKAAYCFDGSGKEIDIYREISHFKLVLRRDQPMEAKAYLLYYPLML